MWRCSYAGVRGRGGLLLYAIYYSQANTLLHGEGLSGGKAQPDYWDFCQHKSTNKQMNKHTENVVDMHGCKHNFICPKGSQEQLQYARMDTNMT